MKNQNQSIITLALVFIFALSGCSDKGAFNFNDGSKEGETKPILIDASAEVTYNSLKEIVLENKCLNCHNSTRSRGGVDLSSYEAILAAKGKSGQVVIANDSSASVLYLEVFNGTMPPRTPLTEEEIALIKKWIDTGAIEEKPKVLPLAQTKANYANLYERILKDKCIRCHNKDRARAEVDLSSYGKMFDYSEYFSAVTEAGNPDGSALYTEVFNGNMPPRGNHLSEEEIAFIKRWILEGAIE